MKENRSVLAVLVIAILCTVLMANDPASFANSSDYKSEKKSPVAEKLGIYKRLVRGPNEKGIMNRMLVGSGLDWMLPSHPTINPAGEPITAFVYNPEGTLMSPGELDKSKEIMTFCRTLASSKPFLQARLIFPNGARFPSNTLDQYELMALNMSFQSAKAAGHPLDQSENFKAYLDQRCILTPEEALEEKSLHEEEIKAIGKVDADLRARARAEKIRKFETARLKQDLRIGVLPEDMPLIAESEAREQTSRKLAENDKLAPEERPGWIMLIYVHECSVKGISVFSKWVFTGEVFLFKDKVLMAAGRQRSMAVGPTSGGLSNMALRNGQILSQVFN